jgi:Zn finger protein HypA/HybF involved in hydrogenase expression
MLKIQNNKGDTVFVVKDDATKPEATLVDYCSKCKQSGEGKPGEYPCPKCGRNLLHDEDLEDSK